MSFGLSYSKIGQGLERNEAKGNNKGCDPEGHYRVSCDDYGYYSRNQELSDAYKYSHERHKAIPLLGIA